MTELRHILITLTLLAAPFIAKHFPSADPVDACDSEIVMHELGRMQDVESAMLDHIELDMELDEQIRTCHDDLGHEMALRDLAEAQLQYTVPPLLSDTHLREDYFREQRLLGALEERDQQEQRAKQAEQHWEQCQNQRWEDSRTFLTQDHIDQDVGREAAFRAAVHDLERCQREDR